MLVRINDTNLENLLEIWAEPYVYIHR